VESPLQIYARTKCRTALPCGISLYGCENFLENFMPTVQNVKTAKNFMALPGRTLYNSHKAAKRCDPATDIRGGAKAQT
jgi:hypothetical protein